MDYYFSTSHYVTYDDDEQEGIVYTISEEDVYEFIESVWRSNRSKVKSGGTLVITLRIGEEVDEDTN